MPMKPTDRLAVLTIDLFFVFLTEAMEHFEEVYLKKNIGKG